MYFVAAAVKVTVFRSSVFAGTVNFSVTTFTFVTEESAPEADSFVALPEPVAVSSDFIPKSFFLNVTATS